MSTRFVLKFFCLFSKYRLPGKLHFTIVSQEKLALLSLVKEVMRFPNRKMIKLLTIDILFSPARHLR